MKDRKVIQVVASSFCNDSVRRRVLRKGTEILEEVEVTTSDVWLGIGRSPEGFNIL